MAYKPEYESDSSTTSGISGAGLGGRASIAGGGDAKGCACSGMGVAIGACGVGGPGEAGGAGVGRVAGVGAGGSGAPGTGGNGKPGAGGSGNPGAGGIGGNAFGGGIFASCFFFLPSPMLRTSYLVGSSLPLNVPIVRTIRSMDSILIVKFRPTLQN